MKKSKDKLAYISHIGNVRTINQDSLLIRGGTIEDKNFYLMVVADGVGSMHQGEMVSSYAVQRLNRWWDISLEQLLQQNLSLDVLQDTLCQEIININEELVELRKKTQGLAATTLTVGFVYCQQYLVFHAGDSRAYQIRQGSVVQLTKDHTWYTQQMELGALSEKELQQYAKKYALVNALGMQDCMVEQCRGQLLSKDILLFCSDGFYNYVPVQSMKQLENSSDIQHTLNQMLQDILDQSATDNITAIVFQRC